MNIKPNLLAGIALVTLSLGGCAATQAPVPLQMPTPPAIVAEAERAAPQVRSTIVDGEGPIPQQGSAAAPRPIRGGNVSLNLPQADVRAVASSVQQVTGIPIEVDATVNGQVSLVTPGSVARSEIIGLFETALRSAQLALVPIGNGFSVRTETAAKAPVAPDAIGFGTEVITLQFINAEEVRKVIDSAIPGVVADIDPAGNRITIAGTTGQRSSARDMLKQFDVNWLRNMSFGLYVPERTDARLIVPELDKLINAENAPTRGLVRLITMERINGILAVSANGQYLEDVRRWVEILDREGENAEKRIFVYRVLHGRARDLARTLNQAYGNSSGGEGDQSDPFGSSDEGRTRSASGSSQTPRPAGTEGSAGGASTSRESAREGDNRSGSSGGSGGKITADEVNNAIVVHGTPREYALIEDALRKLDIAPLQVMIEAAITEVTLTDTLRYGVQWNWATGDSNFRVTDGTSMPTGSNQAGFSYFLAGGSISAALNALEQRTNVRVVSAPKLVTLNNQTAALQVGDQVPVSTGSAVSVENPNAPIVNAIEYRDTGVILRVTPRVNAGNTVLLDVSQEVSDVNPNSAAANSSSGAASPTISTRRISTSVAVLDGQVIALGGLFRDSQTIGKNGIPILSRIPVLGGLFGNHDNRQNRTELIVLLKPQVIRTPDDGRAVTEELRGKLRTLEPFRTHGTIP
ncbi:MULTISPECIES: type II secretion system secretin GspD [Sphingomonadales]|uniref:Type II secretion system protein D (GspD) n=2 Tax=Sphingomonadaceae TaxID=41297 RepID=A0A397PJT8_9SPHN|nr:MULTISPECIES: type II secretion system secretin GspD [Sphingomonadaceae]EKU73399.1 general secretion pathway protein D [Sphingobium yanoikuyae ATCC 51230]RIA45971.1 type II secretion system protein D (GspD) [Hephaestia caeni]WQE08185.1 type II secretion system secretin GspD [Sphingobium yanoikuyae]